jgi:hypothetical protein
MYPYVTKKASAGGGGGSPTPFYLANATMGTTVSGGTSMQITVSLPSGCNYLRVEMGEANEYSRCDSAYICSTTPDVIGARIGLKDAGGTNLNQESWGIQRSDTSAASVVVRIHMTASIDFAAGVVPVVKANSSAPAGTYNGQSSAGTTSPSFTVEAVSGDTIVVSTLEGNVTGGSVTNIGSVSDLSGYRSFTILKKAYVANPTTVSYATSNSPLNAGGAAVKP